MRQGLQEELRLPSIHNKKQIINIIDEQKIEKIKKLRNRTLILIGFGGGFRRTELISIN